MKDQDKNEKATGIDADSFNVLSQLPKGAIETIKSWYDPDLPILEDYLRFLAELVCYLTIQMDGNEDTSRLLHQTIRLSHLFDDLKTFEIKQGYRLEEEYNDNN